MVWTIALKNTPTPEQFPYIFCGVEISENQPPQENLAVESPKTTNEILYLVDLYQMQKDPVNTQRRKSHNNPVHSAVQLFITLLRFIVLQTESRHHGHAKLSYQLVLTSAQSQ